MPEFADRPLTRGYARCERERRFVVETLPAAVDRDAFERLDDLYIDGTHVRLRLVHDPDGAFVIGKLGQKVPWPEAPDDPRLRSMTTLYLPATEAAVFAALPGLRTRKRRHKLREQGWTFCIDVYEAPAGAAGTMVAEVETDDLDALAAIVCPSWAVREVTDDPRFSAIALARR